MKVEGQRRLQSGWMPMDRFHDGQSGKTDSLKFKTETSKITIGNGHNVKDQVLDT
jgi:hypothetical protein